MQRRLLVAINPNASFGRATDAGPLAVRLLREAGHDVHSFVAPSWELLAERLREELATGADALVMVGGDGMVHLGANLVGGTSTPLGLVPTGTGNDLAKAFGVPEHDVPGAVALLLDALESGPVVIDTAIATWDEAGTPQSRRIVGAVSCGFDAIVNERANAMRYPKGASRYTIAILRELIRLRPIPYRIEHDGGIIEVDGVLASVANNRSFGGGMLIAPEASLTDGLLDLFVVEALGRVAFLRIYPRVFRGEHVTDRRVRLIRTRRAVVSAPGIIGYADGERLGPLPVEVVVDPGSLRFLGRIAATGTATAS